MAPRLFSFVLLGILPAISFASDPPTLAHPAVDPADAELSAQLKKAEASYAEGVALLKEGKTEEGRAAMRKAFDAVIANLEEDALPAALHAEFSSMLDKIRNWDGPEEDGEEPSGLAVTEESLKAGPSAAAVASKMRDLKLDADNPITQKFVEIYSKQRPRTVEEALARSGRYKDMIETALKDHGLPKELFYLVMAESEYKADALSHSGAAGLWQFMPGTARKYGLEVSYWLDERYVPEKATQAAVRYLSDLYQWFGDWNLAIAAYNRGEGGLGRDMQFSRSPDFSSLAGRNALPDETHHYVPKFMACVLIGEHPSKYGLHPKYEDPDDYDAVALPRALDLAVAARCAGAAETVIHRLNPGLRAWCTPKDRPGFELRVPKGSKQAFEESLLKVTDWNPGPTMLRYKVRPGDSLGKIAVRNRTTVRAILEINKLKNPRLIHPGMTLSIRPGRESKASKPRRKSKKK
ncbi:MAG: transglycosylase SLT domain-containing protein [Elusimicrobia bacterium]|nr:transglycosylase SLT domain-containing protein [Elusimicrobiota bacterium]